MGLRNIDKVVAVTADGTNDVPSLGMADVGLALSYGTDLCKVASILYDDSFTAILKACLWGRNFFENIKRFLQFQLTANVSVLIFTMFGATLFRESPLSAS